MWPPVSWTPALPGREANDDPIRYVYGETAPPAPILDAVVTAQVPYELRYSLLLRPPPRLDWRGHDFRHNYALLLQLREQLWFLYNHGARFRRLSLWLPTGLRDWTSWDQLAAHRDRPEMLIGTRQDELLEWMVGALASAVDLVERRGVA